MKDNTRNDVQDWEGPQNQLKRAQAKATRQSSAKRQSQELKGMEKQSQFGFKKKERPGRGRPKLTANEHKAHCQTGHPPLQDPLQKEAPKPHSFPEKSQSKQQCDKNKQVQKRKSSKIAITDNASSQPSKAEKEVGPRSKREAKELKVAEKSRSENAEPKEDFSEEGGSNRHEQQQPYSQELLSVFRQHYPYYLIGDRIIFPVQDSLLSQHPELLTLQGEVLAPIPAEIVVRLPRTFQKELQIWNMLVENASFFKLEEEIKISSIRKIFRGQQGGLLGRLWKQFNRFYINDILYHHYEEANNEDYFSFISLWKYTDQNNFLDRLFHTNWNKFLHFYIRLIRPRYSNPTILSQLSYFEGELTGSLQKGEFQLPGEYARLLEFIILMLDMSFETHTFKTLVNEKMLYFRDNNKMKNQLLEEKKNYENCLSELKDNEKALVKRDKLAKKGLKKEGRTNQTQRLQELQKQIDELAITREQIQAKRESYLQKINDIENKIYALCCLPEFSNVWLLGEDRNRNLYWFVRQQESAIYREERDSGQWGVIRDSDIEKLHQNLNCKGIRERKLYEKMLYYKQLGYIKTTNEAAMRGEMMAQEFVEGEAGGEGDWQREGRQLRQEDSQGAEFEKFQYGEYALATPQVVKMMILKSEWMMTKYLYERNSKWASEESRQSYISKMSQINLRDTAIYPELTSDLRSFNEKICVVEINIKLCNESEEIEVKTRKIQTKIWGINEKYKHFWYDYSRKCRTLSDLHFLVSVLYLTIQRYVNKTRKPNNTKYFFKTVEFGEQAQLCQMCQTVGDLQACADCESLFHGECLLRHGQECARRLRQVEDFVELGAPSDLNS